MQVRPVEIEETEEQEPSTPNTSVDTLDDRFDFAAPIQVERGRPKGKRKAKTAQKHNNTHAGESNLKMHVENMNEDQLQQATETINEDPNNITFVDNNGNDGNYNIKTESVEPENNNVQVRRSTRIKTANPIIRLVNPITY